MKRVNEIMLRRLPILPVIFSMVVTICTGKEGKPADPADDRTSVLPLRKKIDNLLANPLFSSASIGIRIVSLQNGKSLYSLNQDKLLHPASNQKIVLTAASLRLLGPDFRYRTDFGTDGTISRNILEGNLIIRGCGDPLISTADLDSVAAALRRLGIDSLRGNVIGNISYFDSLIWGKGWMWDDEPYPEAPFISPLSVNKNAVSFLMRPGMNEKDTIRWEQDPKTGFVSVLNAGYTSDDTSLPHVTVGRAARTNSITINGVMAPTDTGEDILVSVWQPEQYFLFLLRERLKLAGIRCDGALLTDDITPSVILTSVEHPLDSVLHRINKESDNLAAENLLKTIGAEITRKPGRAADAVASIKTHLHTLNIDTSLTTIADGSGASWYNTSTARILTEILLNEHKNKATFPHFYGSLSIAGKDGTLKNRMKKPCLIDRVRAKTGTLTGVNCVSGYVRMRKGGMAAFSIMVNHFTCKNADVRQLQDDIIEAIASSSLK